MDHFEHKGPNNLHSIEFENPAIAAILGCFLGGGFIWFLGANLTENATRYGTFGLSALTTLVAAAFAWSGVMKNISNQQRLESSRREKSLRAARAMLPLTLSNLYKQSEQAFENTILANTLKHDTKEAKKAISAMRLSQSDNEVLAKCIEYADGPAHLWLSLIPAYWQLAVANSESATLDDYLLAEGQLEDEAINWLVIRSICDSLFRYARVGEQPAEELKRDRLCVPLLSKHAFDKVLAGRLQMTKKYFDNQGGWGVDGFQERLIPSWDN